MPALSSLRRIITLVCLRPLTSNSFSCLPGNGFQEVIYQRYLAIELSRVGLNFSREVEQKLFYDGIYVGTEQQLVVENKVIVELKAQIRLEPVHLAQAKNYVVAYNFEKGINLVSLNQNWLINIK